jgi:hypothetical protein
MTDDSGRVRDGSGDQGIDSLTSRADIRVLCQNSVPRVLDGNRLNLMVYQDKNAGDGSTVYGCIFVDFGRRAGLRTAVNACLRSAADGVTTFGAYKNWISSQQPEHLDALEAAQQAWGL